MSKKSLLIVLITISTVANAQVFRKSMFAKKALLNLENFDKQRVYFGFYLGFNNYDFKIDKKYEDQDIIIDSQTGFNVGLIADLRLMEYLNLRFEPGLSTAQRNLHFPHFTNSVDALREVKTTNIHFPLLLKFSSKRIGNVRPYVLGGISTDMNLSSNANSPDDNSSNRFRMTKNTSNYELGLGIDLYMEYFKFSPSIRGVFGMKNELIPDNNPNSPWTGNIDQMRTRGIFINFAFH
ncbi:PorT family protein [Flavobacterium psychrophilum]|uniref:type IX secretion/gliding motility protein PorT/SprT n=1 Tax=Flavobacterium psychrophilum TaxID=96345 RepID=UPI00090413DD|nr:porin family protein [Flavobacterium psychrophilum]ELM3644873.1 PorT family protein [Flavobacterium psychrophilum]ELY1978160.1 PorT family protein [Flavobacterium psychrophilum]ELY2018093.1 PorT family protein [Flavobacterium psychrophilum]OJH12471.1 PorT protein [Flavobacterium psychrophilum]SNB44056.1 PorT protein [Flavobacterium psychrophilum]